MKHFRLAILCLLLLGCRGKSAEPLKLESQADKASYGIGLDIGRNFKQQSIAINPEALAQGIRDGFNGAEPKLSEEDLRAALEGFQSQMMAQQEAGMKGVAERNKKEGEVFLAANKDKPGVVTLPSGLQYIVVKPGAGRKPKPTDTVVTHYRGTLIDGKVFDSSYDRGEPISFPVNGVIAGWTEALQLMPEGAKWQLFVPSQLAYGERGAGPDIGPNATLIFDVELIQVK